MIRCTRKIMNRILREAINIALIILGIPAGLGLKGFLLSSRFINGGVTGVSMLLSNIFGWPLAILILVINLPFIALGFRQIGKIFALKTVLAITGLSLCLAFIKYPDVTPTNCSREYSENSSSERESASPFEVAQFWMGPRLLYSRLARALIS